jgi:hypothetical protein
VLAGTRRCDRSVGGRTFWLVLAEARFGRRGVWISDERVHVHKG